MKVAISGIFGFVGQNLSKHLKNKDYEVQSLSLRNSDWKSNFDSNANAIIHLAGKAHDTKNTSNASEYFIVNTELTQNLFDAFLESNVQDFIYFSSVKAVADTVDEVLFENVVGDPKTAYGQSKLQSEQYIVSKNLPENKRFFIIRPCMIHGPGNKGNLNLLYNVVKKGIPYPLGAFHNERSFLSIDNLNFLIQSILENKNIASGIYNFADDELISTNELIGLISIILNKKPKIWSVSKSIIKTVAKIGDVLKLTLNSEKLQKLTENYKVSNQKIKKALDIQSLPFTAQQGLEITIKSFVEIKQK
jgi:nucleoside-diphosphate-sugar epimerase